MKKARYIDLMEKTLSAYSNEHIQRYFEQVQIDGLKEHGFPRLTANIGILISHGKRLDLYDIFCRMMDFCCENIPKVKAANDFSVKEIIWSIMAIEKSGAVPTEHIERWKDHLKTIEPEKCYSVFARTEADEVYNWAAFSMLSEWMRLRCNLAKDTEKFIDIQAGSQLKFLDPNGMYRDPNEPMVYDLVTRGLFAVAHHFGYRGKYYQQWESALEKAGTLALRMQSVTGEIPFGGRSNQFLHNEAHISIILEYEAARYARKGNRELAGLFKCGIRRALDNIEKYLSQKPIHHVKNRFPTESFYGCEEYAYFDKYMITAASFMYAAYLMSDDSIHEVEINDQKADSWQSSDYFHKLFLRAGEYFAEWDLKADKHYDASGLGRLHRKGAPSGICLSTPCTAAPSYKIDYDGAVDLAITPGAKVDGKWVFGTAEEVLFQVIKHEARGECATAEIDCRLLPDVLVKSSYKLDKNGLEIQMTGSEEIGCLLPAFSFDGETKTKIRQTDKTLEIYYQNWVCRYTVNGQIEPTNDMGCNRNGYYQVFRAVSPGRLNIKIEIEKKRF